MRIALYHGYELTGSGSNEYTRYLAAALAERGHAVSIVCSEPHPERLSFVGRVVEHAADGSARTIVDRPGVVVHRLPVPPIYPVYLTDKQRPGHVKAFVDLTDAELATYRDLMTRAVTAAVQAERPDVLFANHVVMQPAIAAACGVPFVVVPHGSAIEYAVRPDPRYRAAAIEGLSACAGIVWISDEVRERVHALLPEVVPHLAGREHRVGIGTDTSRFRPIAHADKATALETLARLHRPGGKRPEQTEQLHDALRRGDLESTRRFWDAYDHEVEDDRPLEFDPDDDIVLFMGALAFGKGVHTLVAAMAELILLRPRARLLIVGSGTFREVLEAIVFAIDTGDLALLEALCLRGRALDRDGIAQPLDDVLAWARDDVGRRTIARVNSRLSDRITFVGRLDHERLQWLLPLARVAAFPSVIKEASPLVFAEALAAGVLPAGADHSGFRAGLDALEQFLPRDLVAAMRLPTSTHDRVVGTATHLAALLDHARDPTLPSRLRAIAVDHYDWSKIAAQIETVAVKSRRR